MEADFKDETIIKKIDQQAIDDEKLPAIHFLSGPGIGRLYPLPHGEVTLGRNENSDIVVNDPSISRFHSKFSIYDGQVFIEDLKSANGTYVNGEKIKRQLLTPGDKVQLSTDCILSFVLVDAFDTDSFNRLYDMAVQDGLTGAYTKRYLLDQAKQEISYALRRGTSLSIIIFDLDHFKHINDQYGHLAGDYILKKVSETTNYVIRKEDLFARYGGEEFVILMRNVEVADACKLAERLRLIIEEFKFVFDGEIIPVTLSLGVSSTASFDKDDLQKVPEEEGSIQELHLVDQLISAADQKLYQAKQRGRNRVCY